MPARNRYILFASVLMLVVGLGMVGVGVVLEGESASLLIEGVVSPARVIDRRVSGSGTNRTYLLFLAPANATGVSLRHRTVRDNYDALPLGSEVTVTWRPGSADAIVLGGMEEVRAVRSRALRAQVFGGVGGVVGLLLGGAFVVLQRRRPQVSR